MKTAESSIAHWPDVVDVVFWAKRVTIQKATGMSPYYIVHRVEPVLPFDLAEATYMSPELGDGVSTTELLAIRAKALLKRDKDLEECKVLNILRFNSDTPHVYYIYSLTHFLFYSFLCVCLYQ